MSRVTFSSNLTVDHAVSLPEFQNNYGQTADGTSSWGDKGNLTDYDNVGNWFGNGITAINSLTFQTGNDKMQTYFSYANTREQVSWTQISFKSTILLSVKQPVSLMIV